MQSKMPFACLFKDKSTLVRTSVTAVDVRDAITRFFTSDVGMPLAHANAIPVDLLQTVPANFDTQYTLSGDGWEVSVRGAHDSQGESSMSPLGDVYVPEGPVRNTILAALRYYQEQGQGEPANRSDAIHAIATNGGDDESMDEWAIEALCQSINFSELPATPLVIVRCTPDDEIIVQADHSMKVVYLADNRTGDDGDDLVVLDEIEMWKQEFDVQRSDLSTLRPELKLTGANNH